MASDGKRKIPVWFLVSGFVVVALLFIGSIVEPGYHVMNNWKIAAIIVSAISITTMLLTSRKKG